MVLSHNRFFQVLSIFLFWGFSLSVDAQVTPRLAIQQQCTPENSLSPPLDAAPMPKNIVVDYKNQFQCRLAWERIPADSCQHNNPPTPWMEGQDSLARWVYFWNFGDGTFSRDSAPEHVFPVGTFVVQAAIKPIYSDDDDPLGYVVKTVTIDSLEVPLPDTNLLQNSNIALNANWSASRPGGRLLFALTYNKIQDQAAAPRTVYLMFPDDEFEFAGMQSGQAPADNFTELYEEKTHRIYSWHFEGIENNGTPYPENSLFVELKVKDAVANLLPDTMSELVTSVKAMYSQEVSVKTSFGGLIGSQSPDPSGGKGTSDGVPNSTFFDGIDEIITHPISLNWASDPNAMSVIPGIIEPGPAQVPLDYRIDFFNSGKQTADFLQIDATIDNNRLESGLLQTGSTFPTNLIQTFEGADIRWATNAAGLLSLGQAQTAGFPDEHAFGFVNFRLPTKVGLVLHEGDTIKAHAHIKMEDSEVTTNEAIVRVKRQWMRYPCVLGFKFYYNFRFDNNAFHRSGFNLAFTLRKALCKISNPQNRYFFQSRIPKSAFPMFWWQGELGYGQTKLGTPETADFQVGHLDLTPAMLRFIAKKPDFKIKNQVIPRGWGLSAGYTASFLLHGKRSGKTIDFGSLSFGDRLDHSISASLDLFNLLGRPGLSFGFGWRWRNSAITGTRDWYDHPFVYAHYTFSPGLRYELKK